MSLEIPQTNENSAEKELPLISEKLKASHADLLEKIKGLRQANPALDQAIGTYGGTEFLHNFRFQCYNQAAVGLGREDLFNQSGTSLGEYAEANKGRNISLEELKAIEAGFKERKEQIISKLSQTFATPAEAKAAIKEAHMELVLQPLNPEPLFS